MTRSRMTARCAVTAALAILLCSSGCGMNRRYANNTIRQLPHTDVNIEYARTAGANDEVQQSSTNSLDSGKWIMTIVYPHPSPKYGKKYAEVKLRRDGEPDDSSVTNAVGQLVTNPFKKQELQASGGDGGHTLRLTITREELEFLMRDLVADSYFDREARKGDVNIRVTLGSRTTHKPWDRVASFDQLAQRVINEHERRAEPHAHTGGVTPASAELLPPTIGDSTEPPPDEPKARRHLHNTPSF